MDTSELDYDLATGLVAQVPAEPRDSARLLVDRGPGLEPEHLAVRDLPRVVEPGDLVVINTTRVMAARLMMVKQTGGAAEVLLLERREDIGEDCWEALVRPSRRLPPGTRLASRVVPDGLGVEVGEDLGEGRRLVRLDSPGGSVREAVLDAGEIALPPYIKVPLCDPERYQTVFSHNWQANSVAAPTAGLHLTAEVIGALDRRGVFIAEVELAVGLGTFRPIEAERVEDHAMHGESYEVSPATMEACEEAHRRGGRVVAVGTTTVRALESAAASGCLRGRTDLFIRGAFEFRVVDRLVTNFHVPRSSLLAMVEAFAGPRWRGLYEVAMSEGYRFLSFGDAMVLTRHDLCQARTGGPVRYG